LNLVRHDRQQLLLGRVGEMDAEVGVQLMGSRPKFLPFSFGPAAEIQDHVDAENQRSCSHLP
jgi:hypothetical protein